MRTACPAQMLEIRVSVIWMSLPNQLLSSIERQINDFDRFTLLPYYTPEAFEFLKSLIPSKNGTMLN